MREVMYVRCERRDSLSRLRERAGVRASLGRVSQVPSSASGTFSRMREKESSLHAAIFAAAAFTASASSLESRSTTASSAASTVTRTSGSVPDGTQHDAPLPFELAAHAFEHALHVGIGDQRGAAGDADVDGRLRNLAHAGDGFVEALPASRQRFEHLQRADDRIAAGGAIESTGYGPTFRRRACRRAP